MDVIVHLERLAVEEGIQVRVALQNPTQNSHQEISVGRPRIALRQFFQDIGAQRYQVGGIYFTREGHRGGCQVAFMHAAGNRFAQRRQGDRPALAGQGSRSNRCHRL